MNMLHTGLRARTLRSILAISAIAALAVGLLALPVASQSEDPPGEVAGLADAELVALVAQGDEAAPTAPVLDDGSNWEVAADGGFVQTSTAGPEPEPAGLFRAPEVMVDALPTDFADADTLGDRIVRTDGGLASFDDPSAPDLSPAVESALAATPSAVRLQMHPGHFFDRAAAGTLMLPMPDGTTLAVPAGEVFEGVRGSTVFTTSIDGEDATFTGTRAGVIGDFVVNGAGFTLKAVTTTDYVLYEEGRTIDAGLEETDVPPIEDGPGVGDIHSIVEKVEAIGDDLGIPGAADAIDEDELARMAGPSTVDILMWYDTSAVAFYGTEAAAELRLTQRMNQMNAIFVAQNIPITMNIVQLRRIVPNVSGYGSDLVFQLATDGNGWLDHIHEARKRVNADLVTLIADLEWQSGGGLCGVAFKPNKDDSTNTGDLNTFSVTDPDCDDRVITILHELGHNFGLAHDNDDDGGWNPSSKGYARPDRPWHTIMARLASTSCGIYTPCRKPRFSDPLPDVNGLRWGTAENNAALGLRQSRIPVLA